MHQHSKKKLSIYLMGKPSDNNSIVRAVVVQLDYTNTIKDITDFLTNESRIKGEVWVSLKQGGTKVNEGVTIRDLESIVEDGEEVGRGIQLFVYSGERGSEGRRKGKGDGNGVEVFELIKEEEGEEKDIEEIKLSSSSISGKLMTTEESFVEERKPLENSVESGHGKISKKQALKSRSKNQCCLLM